MAKLNNADSTGQSTIGNRIMKFIFFLLFCVFVATTVILLKYYPGTILITLPHWSIESPIWLGILTLLIAFLMLHYFLRGLVFIKNISPNWKKRKAVKKLKKTLTTTKKALCYFIENDWARAEKYFMRAASIDDDFPEAKIMAIKSFLKKKPDAPIDLRRFNIENPSPEMTRLLQRVKNECGCIHQK